MQRWLTAVVGLVLGVGILTSGGRAGRGLAQGATPQAGIERHADATHGLVVGDLLGRA
ncbi:MAG: hypothetical protein M3Q71_09895 [Chloroflexota bacterium]|nr:hypothetical protein [Chloroflexota bacterium]